MESFQITLICLIACFIQTIAFLIVRKKQNSFSGIRTTYTLEYKDVWVKTHNLSVVVSLIALLSFIFVFTKQTGVTQAVVAFIMVLLPDFVGILYSYIIGNMMYKNQEMKEEIEKINEEKKIDDIHINR